MWTIPDGERGRPTHFSLLLARLTALAGGGGERQGEAGPELHYRVCCYLLDAEFHLEEILRRGAPRIARASRGMPACSRA